MQGVDGPRCPPLLALLVGSVVVESTKLVERGVAAASEVSPE